MICKCILTPNKYKLNTLQHFSIYITIYVERERVILMTAISLKLFLGDEINLDLYKQETLDNLEKN